MAPFFLKKKKKSKDTKNFHRLLFSPTSITRYISKKPKSVTEHNVKNTKLDLKGPL